MARHPKRKMRHTSKPSSRHWEPVTPDAAHRARTARAVNDPLPCSATRPPRRATPAENAVTEPVEHRPEFASHPLASAPSKSALPPIDRHALPKSDGARKGSARYRARHRFSLSILTFTALTTLAFFETVRAQSPWSPKAQRAAVMAFAATIPPPAILQPSNTDEFSVRETRPELSVPVRVQNSPETPAVAADTEETLTAITPPAPPASLAPVESAGGTGSSSLTAPPIRFGSTKENTPSAISPDSLATFPEGLPECMASRSEVARLTPMEVASLIRAGRQFLATGDIDAARIAFKRAADSCDTDASYLMGTSFDPRLLTASGLPSSIGDVRMARSWYERARNLGSAEAADQLARLRKRS
jgi:hypothetical protein